MVVSLASACEMSIFICFFKIIDYINSVYLIKLSASTLNQIEIIYIYI